MQGGDRSRGGRPSTEEVIPLTPRQRKRAHLVRVLISQGWSPPPPGDDVLDRILHDIERLPDNATPDLADSELSVLRLAAEGHTTQETASRLGIGFETVKAELAKARRRLGARNTAHAVAIAARRGLIPR
jgi:DNA-binding CsgD family transcriptional regulator